MNVRGRRRSARTRIVPLVVACLLVIPALARAQSDQVTYYHTDAISSVRMVTDQSGQVVGRYDYLPFGELWGTPPTPADSRGFAGKERDGETGFEYFGARYYTSGTGRFTTVDPVVPFDAALRDPQLWNRYAYVRNNPLRYTDPDGRCIWDFCIGEATLSFEAAVALTTAGAWLISPPGRARTRAFAESTSVLITNSARAIAETFWRMSNANDAFEQERTKLNNLKGHLTPKDIEGARRDLANDPVLGPKGEPYDHLTEVRDAQRGVQNLIEQLKVRIGSGKLSKNELEDAQLLLGEASRLLDRTRELVPR
jgi:RHS repeat-associated protein